MGFVSYVELMLAPLTSDVAQAGFRSLNKCTAESGQL